MKIQPLEIPPQCRVCGGAIDCKDSRGGLECRSCKSLIVEVVPDDNTLAAYYKNYNDTYSGGGSSAGRNQIRYAHQYLRRVMRHTLEGDLLDIGCANNPFPNVAVKHGFDVTAMDYAKPAMLDPDVIFQNGHFNSRELLNSGKTFDVVTAWAVIEHVADPDLAFQILAVLVRKGGYLHMTTPEYGTLLTIFSPGRTKWFYPPEHLHLLSPDAMGHLAKRHGFRLINWNHFEISRWRWLARYGIGLVEMFVGLIFRTVNRNAWRARRKEKSSYFTGIAYYVFQRLEDQ